MLQLGVTAQLYLASKGKDIPEVSGLAAAAKSLQSCPTLCDPIDGRPPGSPVPGILQARTLDWVAISFSNAWKGKVKVKLLSRVQLFATPWTAAHQAPLSVGGVRAGRPKRSEGKGNQRLNFGSCFCFFLLPLSLPYVNWARQEGCLLHLRFSLPSSDLPLFYFRELFLFFFFFLSFLATTILASFFLF